MFWRRLAAGLAAGLLLTATLPPWGWWPLGPLGVAVLALALEGSGGWRRRFLVGAAAGLGLYGPGLWWLIDFHAVGFAAVLVLEVAILAAAVALVPPGRAGAGAGAGGRWSMAAALPAALVVAEAVRGRWPFGGLPLAGIDLGQVGGPLLPVARVGGHLLVVAVVGLVGVGVAHLVRALPPGPARSGWARSAAGVLALALAVVSAGHLAPDGADTGDLRVAAVQGGGPRGLRAVGRDPRPVFDAHLAATQRVKRPVELVVWPEDVVDVDGPLAGSPEEAELSALARALGGTLVAGVVEEVPGLRLRNAAVAWAPDGRQVARYDKVHRVPFGEYIPFRSFFDRLADVSAVPRDAIPGRGPGVLDTPAGRLGVVISYEVFFAGRARAAITAGGQLLLVPTNASSFTTAQVPGQELAVARLRAVETGRWVVQAAPTGFSAFVDHRGRVLRRGPLGDPAALEASVRLRAGRTLAMRLGDLPVTALAGACLPLSGAISRLRRRKVERN